MNTIQPIRQINSLEELSQAGSNSGASSSGVPFSSLFQDAVANVKQTDSDLNGQISAMATGSLDNLHDVVIASQKANLAVDLVVEMRNKLLDSYDKIMNMGV